MKRKSFLLTSLLAVPVVSIAKLIQFIRTNKPFKVEANKDRFNEDFIYGGDHFYLKVLGKDTDGDLCIYDSLRNQKGGPGAHVHFAQDEWFYVTKGEFIFQIGDQAFNLKEGDTLFGQEGYLMFSPK